MNYWGKQGNAQHVRSILETFSVRDGSTVDVAHLCLLRSQAALHLSISVGSGRLGTQDCFWTALNFFVDHPDDRVPLLDPSLNSINKDYYQIESEPVLGDSAALVASDRKIKHVSVYIADNVVFTKNGGHFLHPWALMKISDMMGKYPADPPLRL